MDMDIPEGFGVPLVDLATHLLPEPTMDALSELFTPEPPAPAEPGLKQYANTAALDNVTDTELGIVSPPTTWGAYFGSVGLNSYAGEAMVRTIAATRNAGATAPLLTQELTVGRHNNGYDIIYTRSKFSTTAWSPWVMGLPVPNPTDFYHAATKAYVDGKSLQSVTWAELSDFNLFQATHTKLGIVNGGYTDMQTLTGLAEFAGMPGTLYRFEHLGTYVNQNYNSACVQRVWIPLPAGELVVIRRWKDDVPDYTMKPWSAWAIES